MRILLLLHIVLLLLASTEFTVVTALFGGDSLRWCYFHYASQSGWGREYVSGFDLSVICAYLVAFGIGMAGFGLARARGARVVGGLGVLLCAIGVVSFAIEGSHWLFPHHRSWILISPLAMFVLAAIALVPRNMRASQISLAA